MTFGQSFTDSAILIRAPGAAGIEVQNQTGVRTDWRGYAILPSASFYTKNRVALDVDHLAAGVSLDNSVAFVIPSRGSITRADFAVRVGHDLLLTLLKKNKPLPFGTTVTETTSGATGIVDDRGRVYLSGLPESGVLISKWGDGAEAKCIIPFHLDKTKEKNNEVVDGLTQLSFECSK